jgi:hypothetical protein
MTIPNPLETGHYTLRGGSYSSDVGSTDPDTAPVLTLEHGAVVDADVAGFGSELGATRYATFDIKGEDTLNLTATAGIHGGPGPGSITVNEEPGARLTGTVTQNYGSLTVNGGYSTRLVNFSGTFSDDAVTIGPAIKGTGTLTLTGLYPPEEGASLTLDGAVSRGETINVTAGALQLDQPMRFLGTIDWDPNGNLDSGTAVTLSGVTATSYSLGDGELRLFHNNHEFLNLNLTQAPGSPLYVSENSQGVMLSYLSPDQLNNGAVALPLHTAAHTACG